MNVYKHSDEYRTIVSGTQEQLEAIKKMVDTYNETITKIEESARPNEALSQMIWNHVYTAHLVTRPEGMAFLVIDMNFADYIAEYFDGLKNDYDKSTFEGNDNAEKTISSLMDRKTFDAIVTLYNLLEIEYWSQS